MESFRLKVRYSGTNAKARVIGRQAGCDPVLSEPFDGGACLTFEFQDQQAFDQACKQVARRYPDVQIEEIHAAAPAEAQPVQQQQPQGSDDEKA